MHDGRLSAILIPFLSCCAMALTPFYVTNDPATDSPPAVTLGEDGNPWLVFLKDGEGAAPDAIWVGHIVESQVIWPPSPIFQSDGVLATGSFHPYDIDICTDESGRIWVAYICLADHTLRCRFYQEGWSAVNVLGGRPGCTYSHPHLAVDDAGVLWIACTRYGGNGDAEPIVYYWDGNEWVPGIDPSAWEPAEEPNLLNDDPVIDQVAGIASDGTGNLWLLLSSSEVDGNGNPLNWDLRALWRHGGEWTWAPAAAGNDRGEIAAEPNLHEHGGWGRSLARREPGEIYVSFSRFPFTESLDAYTRNSVFDAFTRTCKAGVWDPVETLMASSYRAEMLPTLSCESGGRMWAAWQGWCGCGGNQFNMWGGVHEGVQWGVAPETYSTRLTWSAGDERIGKGLATSRDGSAWLFWMNTRSSGATDVQGMVLFAPTPTPADADGDSLPDALETGCGISGTTNKYLPDSDGDGLQDGVEDADRNGIMDPGESSGLATDSDGDRYEDGVETLLMLSDRTSPADPGTEPIDPDRDALPSFVDPWPLDSDSDDDRILDGFEGTHLGPAAVEDPLERPTLGDVDRNSVVDNADAQLILGFFAYEVPARMHPEDSDTDRNSCIDNADCQVTLNFFARYTQCLPFDRQ